MLSRPVIGSDASTAGGDATRIHGISFAVEDPKPFTDSLREEVGFGLRLSMRPKSSLARPACQ